jgi:hypothetical protein
MYPLQREVGGGKMITNKILVVASINTPLSSLICG